MHSVCKPVQKDRRIEFTVSPMKVEMSTQPTIRRQNRHCTAPHSPIANFLPGRHIRAIPYSNIQSPLPSYKQRFLEKPNWMAGWKRTARILYRTSANTPVHPPHGVSMSTGMDTSDTQVTSKTATDPQTTSPHSTATQRVAQQEDYRLHPNSKTNRDRQQTSRYTVSILHELSTESPTLRTSCIGEIDPFIFATCSQSAPQPTC